MIYSRFLYKELKKHLKEKQVTVLTGMRRTGKTTLVKQLLDELESKNKLYLDLEFLDIREIFQAKNYDLILYALKQRGLTLNKKIYLALDEIQLVHNLPSVIKYLYDNHDIKFIVTGSSSYYLKNLFTESLAGRKRIFELNTLSFGEFLTFKEIPYSREKTPFNRKFNSAEYERIKTYYEEYVEYGAFPEVALKSDPSQKMNILADIVSSYINIDIKSLADFRKDREIYALLKMLASRVGTRLDYSKLAILSGLSRPTVHSYIDFFEKTYLIKCLPVFTGNADKEITKATKIHFCDNGLLTFLAQVSSGVKFENAVFNQLAHYGKLRYYALKSGREIDFILNENVAVEVKESPTARDLYKLQGLTKGLGIKRAYLLGRYAVPNFSDYIWSGEVR